MPVTIHERASGVLLTKGDIEAWKAEIVRLSTEAERIHRQIEVVYERIEAAEYFLELARPKAALEGPAAAAANQDMPLTDAILRIMERERRPLKASDIRAQLNRDPFQAARLKTNPNYYHTAMKRLRDRKLIIRDGETDRLPPKANEAPSGNAVGAPEADGAATPSNHQPQTHDL